MSRTTMVRVFDFLYGKGYDANMVSENEKKIMKDFYDGLISTYANRHPFVVVNACTHGHEHLGLRVIERLKGELASYPANILYTVANPTACERNIQYIDADLNRVFPGKENGNHEETVAFFMSPLIRAADIVFDIHSTTSFSLSDESAVILTHMDDATRRVVEAIRPPKAVLMTATKDNALMSEARIGIGMEYGQDNDDDTLGAVANDIRRALSFLSVTDDYAVTWHAYDTEYYEAYGVVPKPAGFSLAPDVLNYRKVFRGDVYARNGNATLRAEEDFYPFLFGENRYMDMFGFSARKLL